MNANLSGPCDLLNSPQPSPTCRWKRTYAYYLVVAYFHAYYPLVAYVHEKGQAHAMGNPWTFGPGIKAQGAAAGDPSPTVLWAWLPGSWVPWVVAHSMGLTHDKGIGTQ